MTNSISGHSFRQFVEQEVGKFPHFVIYAVLEWTLIAMLFLDGFLALASTEFAEFFGLTAPCVLCTRIDHILTSKKLRYSYNNCICEGHKKELSSLAYCHVHGKLCDLRMMCEGCLLSFGAYNSSDPEAHKSVDGLFDEERRIRLEPEPNENGMLCSCCGEAMKVNSKGSGNISNPPNLSRIGSRLSQPPVASPRSAFVFRRSEEAQTTLDVVQTQRTQPQVLITEQDTGDALNQGKEDAKSRQLPVSTEPEELNDDVSTPSLIKANRSFRLNLPDSAAASPRWANRLADSVLGSPRWGTRLGGDSVLSSPRWANRLGDNAAVGSPKWAHRGSRKSLLDRVELAPDPVDTIAGNETDTEAIINRLKRQVRQDRKSLIALYMELDEERSASAVAANNAMAMITRLQAEKASVQMESLQYQRMMEEQAEYDQEALEMLREMLNKREDEIKELESELVVYRERYGMITEDIRGHHLQKSLSFSSFTEKSDHESPLFSINATDTEMEINEHISDKNSRLSDEDGLNNGGKLVVDDDDDRDGGESLMDIDYARNYLFGQLRMLESRLLHSSTDSGGVDTASAEEQTGAEEKDNVLAKELWDLGQKLRTLEEDTRFLKHALLTLKKDRSEGSKLLMEIAQNLQRLRLTDNLQSQQAIVIE